jgi:hypothetical protein
LTNLNRLTESDGSPFRVRFTLRLGAPKVLRFTSPPRVSWPPWFALQRRFSILLRLTWVRRFAPNLGFTRLSWVAISSWFTATLRVAASGRFTLKDRVAPDFWFT